MQIKNPPYFAEELKDTLADIGSNISLQVKVQGEPKPLVSWFFNGKKISSNKHFFISSEFSMHTLNIIDINKQDEGIIGCLVSNSVGEKQCKCNLTVSEIDPNNNNPSLYTLNNNVKCNEDSDAEITVKYSGSPSPKINWYRGEIHLTKEYGVDIQNNGEESKMILPEVTIDDAGVYKCVVRNKHGEMECKINLEVIDKKTRKKSNSPPPVSLQTQEGPPEIYEQFQDTEVFEGDPASFQIKCKSASPVTVKYFHNNKEVVIDNVQYQYKCSHDLHRLFIPVCRLNDTGEYRCKVENIHGKAFCFGKIDVQETIFSPKFLSHSDDLIIKEGAPCEITATIIGKPTPTVEWYKENKSLTEKKGIKFKEDKNVYSAQISEVKRIHCGTYKITAFNNAGESSCIVNLSLEGDNQNTGPSFKEPLCDIKALCGDYLKLDVTIAGSPKPNIAWFKNGEKLFENENIKFVNDNEVYSLVIEKLSVDDSGIFQCEAVNNLGLSSCECSVMVEQVKGMPYFTKELNNIDVTEHDKNLELEVIVDGEPTPEVSFYKDNFILESSDRRIILHEGNQHLLLFKYAKTDDSGKYTASAFNENGEVLTSCVVNVHSKPLPPQFTECHQKYDILEGDELILFATATGIPSPEIMWYKNESLLQNSDLYTVRKVPGLSQLTIHSVTSLDHGQWICEAKNSEGSVKVPITVNVSESKKHFPPEFSSYLNDLEVAACEKAYFEVGIVGQPEPIITWKKDGKILKRTSKILINDSKGAYSLLVRNCQNQDSGCYEIVASNELGEASSQCLLQVTGKRSPSNTPFRNSIEADSTKGPKFLECFYDQLVNIGEDIILEACISGDPAPEICWYRSNIALENNDFISIANFEDGRTFLKIKDAQIENSGEYECVAKNINGETSLSCEVFVRDVDELHPSEIVGKPLAPKISNVPESPTILAGEAINLSFNIVGNPKPKVEVHKNEKVIKSNSRIKIKFIDTNYTFSIPRSTVRDEAKYKFYAINNLGKDIAEVEVLVDETEELEIVTKTIGRKKSSVDEGRYMATLEVNQEAQNLSTSEDEAINTPGIRKSSLKPPRRTRKAKRAVSKEIDGDESDEDSYNENGDQNFQPNKRTSMSITKSESPEDEIKPVTEEFAQSEMNMFESTPDLSLRPDITKEPKNVSIKEGKLLKLSFKANNLPNSKITLKKDGKVLDSEAGYTTEQSKNEVTISKEHARESCQGIFECTIENEHGSTTVERHVNIITTPCKPNFVQRLTDNTVSEGEKAVFACQIFGNPLPDVKFYQDNKIILNNDRYLILTDKASGTYTLEIISCKLRDARFYKCIATNSQGSVTSSANLKVLEAMIAPQFLSKLQDVEIVENKELKLKVEVKGKPKPLLEWCLNEKPLRSSHRVRLRSERDISILQISNCKLDDTGDYKVVASNNAGEISASCKVTITEEQKKPEFIYVPKGNKVQEGRSSSFRVSFNGKPNPRIKWLKDKKEVQNSDRIEIKNDTGKSHISFKNIEPADEGSYTCEITNNVGSANTNVELIVEEVLTRPIFLEKLKEISFVEHETIQLDIEVKGKPKPTISWFRGDSKIKEDDRITVINENNTWSLIIKNCTLSDSAQYKAIAKNKIGETSCKARINVNQFTSVPEFNTKLSDLIVNEGEGFELKVSYDGKPRPKVKWSIDDKVIDKSDVISINTKGLESTLKYLKSTVNDAGLYKCSITNLEGIAETSCSVVINEASAPPVFFTKPLPEMEALKHEQFTCRYQVNGKPKPEVEILKDGKKLPEHVICEYDKESGNGSLKIEKVELKDEGIYTITATNTENRTSSTVCLLVKENSALKFIQKLEDCTVTTGDSATLVVTFEGAVEDVDWYKDNEYIDESEKYRIIDEDTKCTCVINKCTLDDAGLYRCEILNEKQSEACKAQINVVKKSTRTSQNVNKDNRNKADKCEKEAPIFLKEIEPKLEITEGKELVLNVLAKGNPKPRYKFYLDGDEIKSNDRIAIRVDENSAELKIKETTLDDEGEYGITALNTHGSVTCKGEVFVQKNENPPKFILKPSDISIIEGKDTIFEMKVIGQPQPKLNVYKENDMIETLEQKEDVYKFSITKTSLERSGKYKFEAVNSAGKTSCIAELYVQQMAKAAVFEQDLVDSSVTIGDDLELDVKVDGYPPPKVSFYKDNIKITQSKRHKISVDDNRVILKISKTKKSDSGAYVCEIINEAGSCKCSANIVIEPPSKPAKILNYLEAKKLVEGENLSLEVEHEGYPAPNISWFKDGDIINFPEGSNEKVLILERVKLTDEGVYKVTIENSTGSDMKECDVFVKPAKRLPVFTKILENQNLSENESLHLKANIEGYPEPKISWLKDNFELDIDSNFIFESNLKQAEYNLFKERVEIEDSGNFKVLAINELGEAFSECEVFIKELPEKPSFVSKFEDIKIEEGQNCTFEATVFGKPTPEIIWMKGSRVIEEGTIEEINKNILKCSLSFQNMTLDQAGHYSLNIKNSEGKEKHTAKLTVTEIIQPPLFDTEFSDTTCHESQEMILQANCSGSLPLSARWLKNGRPIHNTSSTRLEKIDRKFILRIPKAVINDEGIYSLEVSNSAGSCSVSCNVTVEEAPKAPYFITKLRDLKSVEGREADLTVKLGGKPMPKLTWYLNDQEITDSDNFEFLSKGDGKVVLRIQKLSLDQNGVIKCEARNLAGNTSCTCKLKINEYTCPPEFIEQLNDQTVNEFEKVTFTVKVKGKPEPSIKWLKSRKEITSSDNIEIISNENEHSLILPSASMKDQGQYKVIAKNSDGERTCLCSLAVQEHIIAPVFITLLENTNVNEGQNLTLFTEALGTPKPSISWVHNGKILRSNDSCKIEETDGSCKVEIRNVNLNHSGAYSCTAENKGGEITTSADVEIIPNILEFKKPLTDIELNEGDPIVLTVEVQGSESTSVSFYKDNMILQNIDDISIIEDDNGLWTVTIEGAQLDDGGVYECKANNDKQQIECSCNVRVIGKPEKPTLIATEGTQNQEVNVGESVTFELEILGNPLPIIDWAFGELLLDPCPKYEFIEEGSFVALIIHDVSPIDSGAYICIAANDEGEDELVFNLRVIGYLQENEIQAEDRGIVQKSPPTIITPEEDLVQPQIIEEVQSIPDSVSFDIISSASNDSFDVISTNIASPLKDELPSAKENKTQIQTDLVENGDQLSLAINKKSNKPPPIAPKKTTKTQKPPMLPNVYEEICVPATMKEPSTADSPLTEPQREVQTTAQDIKKKKPPAPPSKSKKLPKGKAPTFSMKPKNKDMSEGISTRFTCNSTGTPDPSISWYFENKLIKSSEKYQVKNTAGLSVLVIREICLDDVGEYMVVAENDLGKCEANFSLSVDGVTSKPPPEFSPASKTLSDKENEGSLGNEDTDKSVTDRTPVKVEMYVI